MTAIARTPEKATALRDIGAEPASVDLFDAPSIAAAVAGHDVVLNLATHIPDVTKAARTSSWAENDRIRKVGSRNLVDAAIAAECARYVQESVSFYYVDAGAGWVTEAATIEAPPFAAAFQQAEAQAARFTEAGGVGVVLRFAMFYGAGSSHTDFQLKTAKRGLSPFPGPKDGYQTFVHLDDAAAAVVAALGVPAGVYNVAEDDPATRRELASAVGAALGRRPGFSIPGMTRLGGEKTAYLARSVRVSSRKFRAASGWSPTYPEPRSGWLQVVAQVEATR